MYKFIIYINYPIYICFHIYICKNYPTCLHICPREGGLSRERQNSIHSHAGNSPNGIIPMALPTSIHIAIARHYGFHLCHPQRCTYQNSFGWSWN